MLRFVPMIKMNKHRLMLIWAGVHVTRPGRLVQPNIKPKQPVKQLPHCAGTKHITTNKNTKHRMSHTHTHNWAVGES